MNPQTLLAFSPFLALFYVLYGFIQAARGKQQGLIAVLLAVLALGAPLAVLLLIKDTAVQTPLLNYLTLNGMIVFVASLVILFIERRRANGKLRGSYGMLGIGLGVLLAAGTLVSPMLLTVAASSGTTGGSTTATSSAFTEALTAQTGLTTEEVTTQIQSGSTIAQLVAAHGGNLNAVITAATSALDEIIAGSGMPAQMLSRLGDTTETATKFVQGELQDRAQQMLVGILTGSGGFPAFGQNPPSGTGMPPMSGTPGAGFAPPSDGNGTPMLPPGDGSGFPAGNPGADATSEPTVQPTATNTPTPTEVVVRPTLIVFPSITPTPAVTAVPATATSAAVTCTITINYNLNLRQQPNTDSAVQLSIPFGTEVVANGRSADGWYSIVYNNTAGWVSGEFATAAAECSALAVVQ